MKKQILAIAVIGIIAISNNQVFGLTCGPVIGLNHSQITADDVPQVTSTDPVDKATDIALNKVISVTFNLAMDLSTINNSNFILKQGETVISGKVECSGKTAMFTPALTMTAGTVYTFTVTTGVKSSMGVPLDANTVFSFTTAGAPALTN
jgi:hypothetical protein